MIGSGLLAAGSEVNLETLGKSCLLPLLLSPVLAVILAAFLYLSLQYLRLRFEITKELVHLRRREGAACCDTAAGIGDGVADGVNADVRGIHRRPGRVLRALARGLNDRPKIAALLLVIQVLDVRMGMGGIALAMATGGLLSASKVAKTMSLESHP